MPVEFTIRDAAGNVTMDLGDRIATILGYVDINNASNPIGSINNAAFLGGEPFAFARSGSLGGTRTKITFAGQQMSWEPASGEDGNTDASWTGRVLYGIR